MRSKAAKAVLAQPSHPFLFYRVKQQLKTIFLFGTLFFCWSWSMLLKSLQDFNKPLSYAQPKGAYW